MGDVFPLRAGLLSDALARRELLKGRAVVVVKVPDLDRDLVGFGFDCFLNPEMDRKRVHLKGGNGQGPFAVEKERPKLPPLALDVVAVVAASRLNKTLVVCYLMLALICCGVFCLRFARSCMGHFVCC